MSSSPKAEADNSSTQHPVKSLSSSSLAAKSEINEPVSRIPSGINFPGAFTTQQPPPHRREDTGELESATATYNRFSFVSRGMKSKVAEAVGGSLANVVGGVYNLVSYVNPLSSGSSTSGAAPRVVAPAESEEDRRSNSTRSNLLPINDIGEGKGPTILESAGTSVAADLDEHSLADANADNPENNRPPTPTKGNGIARMLRFQSPATDSMTPPKEDSPQQQLKQSDPVLLNVQQRTGHQFKPGAEERRRYMKRMGKAPQLESSDDDDAGDEPDADDTYSHVADSQRQSSKAHGIDAWRFITPRTKRVKRRALWRLFLAQAIAPTVYDEVPMGSSPALSPVADTESLRRRMLSAQQQQQGALRPKQSSAGMRAATASAAASIAPSVESQGAGARSGRSAVWAMEFSVCGRYLAAGGQDGVVRVWRLLAFARDQAKRDAQQQQPPAMLRMRTAGCHLSTGSVDGGAAGESLLAFANSAPVGRAKHLRSFSVGGQVLSPCQPCQPPAAAEAAAPEHRDLHPMHAYELLEAVPFRSYAGHSADVLSLSWSKNGFLLSASADRTVRLWHPHRPECLCTFRHRDIVTSVAFSPHDDRLFVSGSLDCRLRLWDIPARGVRHWTGLPDGQMVTAVAFVGAQGDRVVAGTYRGMCVFYATDGLTVLGRMHARSSRGRNAQGSKITGFATASAADSAAADRLLVSSNDSRLRMFLPGERSLERKYKGLANASSQAFARLSSDARYIVSGSEDHNVYVWAAAQDNAATVATHPALDHIRRAGGPLLRAATADGDKSLLGGIFRRRSRRASSISQPAAAAAAAAASASASASAAAAAQSQQQQQDEGSNPKEWESLDGRVEDKSIYEYFAAHDSPVSQALFAPLATLQYLADHEDPILSRPKLRRTAESGDVENLCAPGSDGSFLSSPNAAAAAAAVGGSGSRTVEDMTAIIVSADTSGNIRVFRKDINVRATETSPGAPETSAVEDVAIASAAEDADDSGASTLENSMERRPQSSASHSVMSSTTGGMPRALDRDSSPSFWNRLSRKVTQRRLSSLSGRNHSSSMLSVPSAPVPALPGLRVGEGDCQYCGHHKLIEFAVTASRQSDARIDPLLVCESCKRVKNMPDSINMN